MNPVLREQVRQRTHDCCEYCRMPQICTQLPHEGDHIRAQKHKGSTTLENLCWACALCNGHKGSDVSHRGLLIEVGLFPAVVEG